mmetsp:Transcript_26888/g.80630  ORF Transcript_26888/g.80630 Transcript_26888/m.80630 type:complete len:205 (+) Transcript_26888:2880-3494(+)
MLVKIMSLNRSRSSRNTSQPLFEAALAPRSTNRSKNATASSVLSRYCRSVCNETDCPLYSSNLRAPIKSFSRDPSSFRISFETPFSTASWIDWARSISSVAEHEYTQRSAMRAHASAPSLSLSWRATLPVIRACTRTRLAVLNETRTRIATGSPFTLDFCGISVSAGESLQSRSGTTVRQKSSGKLCVVDPVSKASAFSMGPKA